ncbi:hypothetical protein [Psychrobacter aquimaris]|uniref:hypothetical protein n=1 Tax=Psychrobacter aquimaris TaxID=292733 RepID=UPI0018DF84B9|nr:hypothetical protein [Psychrobacter aquimaris]
MRTKEDIKKELSEAFKGKEIAVSQGEEPWLFTAAVADMIYCEDKYFSGWAQIMAKVDIDLNERSRLSWHKLQLEVDLRENMYERLGLKESNNG